MKRLRSIDGSAKLVHTPRRSFAAAALVLGLSAQACGYSESAMRAQRDRATQLQVQLDRRDRTLAEVRARNEALAESLRDLGGDVDHLTADRDELRENLEASRAALAALEHDRETLRASLASTRDALAQLRAREEQARARAAQFRDLLERFRTMIDAGELSVRIVRGRMVVSLPEAVLFDTGRVDVKPRGRAVLARVGEVLRTIPRDFQVAGHTDNVPIHTARYASNWELSTSRATAVAHLLVGAGLSSARLSAAGHADAQPVATNETPEGRQQNRRIEVVLLPDLRELPDLSSLDAPATTPAPAPTPATP